jgi:hypothetical protein
VHLRHGFGVFAALGEFRTEQVTQLGIGRIASDGGTQALYFCRTHLASLKKTWPAA